MDFIEINISSTTSSEVRLIHSNHPKKKPVVFLKREKDHIYSVDHDPANKRFLVESNWKAQNFRLLETNLDESMTDYHRLIELNKHVYDLFKKKIKEISKKE